MRTFLTGATGYIGSAVLDALLRHNQQVTALVRTPAAADALASRGVTPVLGDLRTVKSYRAAAIGHDAYIHAAADASPHREEIDRIAIDTLLSAASESATYSPVSFVYTSALWVLGSNAQPLDEIAVDVNRQDFVAEFFQRVFHARGRAQRHVRRRVVLGVGGDVGAGALRLLDAAIAVVAEAPPGAELRLQDVAERAGLVRTVVQRHFGGRLSLTRAVQADVLEQAFALITRPVDLSKTLEAVTHSLVGETVHWVVGNPSLHALVERELGDGQQSELNLATTTYADFLVELVAGVAVGRGITLDEAQLAITAVETRVRGFLLTGDERQRAAYAAAWAWPRSRCSRTWIATRPSSPRPTRRSSPGCASATGSRNGSTTATTWGRASAATRASSR